MNYEVKKPSGITRKFGRPKPQQAGAMLNIGSVSVSLMAPRETDCEVREFSKDSGWLQWQDSICVEDDTSPFPRTIPMPLHADDSIQSLAEQIDAYASVTRNSA